MSRTAFANDEAEDKRSEQLRLSDLAGTGLYSPKPSVSVDIFTESRLGLVGKLIPGLCLQVTPGGFSFQLCVKMRHSLSDLSLHL